jgi:hypothetical protein
MLPGNDQIPAELAEAGSETLLPQVHKLISAVQNKEELPYKESISVPIYKNRDKTDCSNYHGITLLSTSYKMLSHTLLSSLSPLGIFDMDFDITDELLIRFFACIKYRRIKWEYIETVHQLFIDFKKAYDSVRREVLYNIFIEFGISMKLVRLIKMCLNETYSKVCIHKHLSIVFLSKMVYTKR